MTTEPSAGEIMRRLDEVARQIADLVAQLREDRSDAANTYVRKDVFGPVERELVRRIETSEREIAAGALVKRVEAIERENDERDKRADDFRRQILLAFISFAIPAVFAAILTVNSLINGSGR